MKSFSFKKRVATSWLLLSLVLPGIYLQAQLAAGTALLATGVQDFSYYGPNQGDI